jgi:4-hydroxy-2-oxoglutarate aldolase
LAKTFTGIYVALVTPFDGDEVSAEKFRSNILKYNETGLAGYLVLGSTGECVSLTDDESAHLVRTARQAAAKGKKVIAGTARESTRLTVEFTNRMADLGIDAALIRPPCYYKSKMTTEALKRHYLAVADRSRVPVILYNIPQNTGLTFEGSLIVELSQHPNITGLKESGGNLVLLDEIIRRLPADFSYLLGHGSAFLPALLMGASGAILAVANAAPDVCAKIYDLFIRGHIAEAAALQLDLVPLNNSVMGVYGIPGLKYAVDVLGLHGGSVRAPLLPLDDKGKAEIAARLKELGLVKK